MDHRNWLSELVFGALLGNTIIAIGFVKFLYKLYKQYDLFMHRYNRMWEDYCIRTKRKISRISDKDKDKEKAKNKDKDWSEDDRTDEDSFLE